MNRKSRPFIILGVIHFILLTIVAFRKKQQTLLVFISNIGVAYVFEYFVLNVFRMYRYSPRIFKEKWVDSIFGAMLSQAVFVPIMGAFLVLFRIGWLGSILAALGYGIIERKFIRWGIFKNYSWKTRYTIMSMPLYFYIVKKWWDELRKPNSKIVSAISNFFCYWVNYTNIYFFVLAFFKGVLFKADLVRNKYWDHFIMVPIYTFIQSIIGTINTMTPNNYIKIVGFTTLHMMDQMIYKNKFISTKKWTPIRFFPVHIIMYMIGNYFHAMVRKYKKPF